MPDVPVSRAVFAARMVQFAGGVANEAANLLWDDGPAAQIEREDALWHLARARRHLDQIEAGMGVEMEPDAVLGEAPGARSQPSAAPPTILAAADAARTAALRHDANDLIGALNAAVNVAVAMEKERIVDGLREEAEMQSCAEDIKVTRENALLIEADFSYDEMERIRAERGEDFSVP